MRILLIGGNGFIGSPLASELRDSGHSVAIFHRSADKSPDKNMVRIQGDRNRLSDHLEQIQRFSPEVIVDLILSSGEQARQLISTSRKVARRVIAISSMDVFAHGAWCTRASRVLWKRCRSQKIRRPELIVSSTRQRL